MGKKKKNKQFDYFDMTPEEQMANANAFNHFEKGEISFLDALNYKVPTEPTIQSSYKKQIEEAYFEKLNKSKNEINNESKEESIYDSDYDPEYDAEINEALNNKDSSVEESNNEEIIESIPYSEFVRQNTKTDIDETQHNYVVTEKLESVVKAKTIVDNIPRISFAYNHIIGKMLIDDGYVTTPITVCHASSLKLDKDNIPDDSDALNSLISKIFFYIISCKHPAVIMSEETFKNEFSIFSKINLNRFIFFRNKGFVYAYVIDKGESDKFYSVKDIFNMDDYTLISYIVGSAYTCNTVHNIFMHEDEDEVESVMEARHSVKELIELIEKDPDTEYAGHNMSRDTLVSMRVTNLEKFLPDMYTILDDLLLADNEDDDEEDDENEYDIEDEEGTSDEYEDYDENNDGTSVDDFPDIDNVMNEMESNDKTESSQFVTKFHYRSQER